MLPLSFFCFSFSKITDHNYSTQKLMRSCTRADPTYSGALVPSSSITPLSLFPPSLLSFCPSPHRWGDRWEETLLRSFTDPASTSFRCAALFLRVCPHPGISFSLLSFLKIYIYFIPCTVKIWRQCTVSCATWIKPAKI